MKGPFLVVVVSTLIVLVSSAELVRGSRNYGESCSRHSDCDKGKHLNCTNGYSCTCRDKMVYMKKVGRNGRWYGECVAKVGSICRIVIRAWPDYNFPCTPNAYCDTETNKCTCMEGFYETFAGRCAAKLEINCRCTFDLQCVIDTVTGSQLVCHNGKCSCEPSESVYATVQRHAYYLRDRNVSSLCAPLPTKNCYKGFCAPGAKCSLWYSQDSKRYRDRYYSYDSAKCDCTYPFELNPTTLRCTSPYNETCSSNIPCIDGLVCSDGRCGCMPRQHFNPHQKKCFSRAGGFCNGTVGCVPNAECDPSNRVCACKPGFVRDSKDLCFGKFGSPCNEHEPCDQSRDNLVCDQGTCACRPGLQKSLNTGRCSLGYNSSCLGTHPCGDDMECSQSGFCDCRDGMHRDKVVDKCLISSRQYCGSGNKCGTNADCKDEFCSCNEGYTETPSGACAADFGTSCRLDSDCAQTNNALVCVNETCACQPKHQRSPTTGLCSLEHGAPCSNNSIPCVDKLVCNGNCSCPKRQFSLDKRCLNYAGKSCSQGTDCIPNANCHNETCTCEKGYVRSAEGLCDPDFGSPCSSSGDCAKNENKLICENGTCACPSGLKMSNKSCSIQLNNSCNGSIPCGDGLVCKQNKCLCPVRSQIFNPELNRCVHRVGGPCDEDSECIAGSFCDRSYHPSSGTVGHCNCPNGTVETRARRCINNTRAKCGKNNDCDTAAGLECIEFQCRCSANAIYSQQQRMCLGFVGTQCIPDPMAYFEMNKRPWNVQSCIPNAVCDKRPNSRYVYECLCNWPKFIEAKNRTCIPSPDYREEVEMTTTSTSATMTTTTTTPLTTTTERRTTTTSKAPVLECKTAAPAPTPTPSTTTPSPSTTTTTTTTTTSTPTTLTTTTTTPVTTSTERRTTTSTPTPSTTTPSPSTTTTTTTSPTSTPSTPRVDPTTTPSLVTSSTPKYNSPETNPTSITSSATESSIIEISSSRSSTTSVPEGSLEEVPGGSSGESSDESPSESSNVSHVSTSTAMPPSEETSTTLTTTTTAKPKTKHPAGEQANYISD